MPAIRVQKRLLDGSWVDTAQEFLRNMDTIRMFGPDGRRVKTYCLDRGGTEYLTSLNYESDADFEADAEYAMSQGLGLHMVREWSVRLLLLDDATHSMEGRPLREVA